MNPEFSRFSTVISRLNLRLAAKVELKKRGHTYRSAAPLIRRTYPWICQVLNGRVKSQPVLDAIFTLPIRDKRGKS